MPTAEKIQVNLRRFTLPLTSRKTFIDNMLNAKITFSYTLQSSTLDRKTTL